MKKYTLSLITSLVMGACSLDGSIFGRLGNGDPCDDPDNLILCQDPNDPGDCTVDTNNDGIIDDSDCNTDPGDPTDPCAPNADGTIPPNCPTDPGCDPATGVNCGCNLDTNNDGIIDGSDCPSDPCAPNADGSVAPGCDPTDPCAPDANGTVGPNCPDPTNPGGCGVDTNNDGVIDGNDCQNTDPCNNPNGGC